MRALTLTVPSFVLLAAAAGCRQSRPGDSGGAATGDATAAHGTGAAPSNDSFERQRPRDTTLPARVHDARGRDTTSH